MWTIYQYYHIDYIFSHHYLLDKILIVTPGVTVADMSPILLVFSIVLYMESVRWNQWRRLIIFWR